MLDTLCSGKLIRAAELKTSQNNKQYCNFLMSVHVGETENIVISGIAFGQHAERIVKLGKGDAVCVIGALKLTEWADKNSGEVRHGLSVHREQRPDSLRHQKTPPEGRNARI